MAEEVIDSYLHDSVQSGYYVLIAENSSHVAGYVCYGPTPLTESTWDIYWIAVTPEKQGKGVGSTLMEAAEKSIKGLGGRLAIIETSSIASYEKTRRFHIRQGYEMVARVPDFYAFGDDKLIMQKRMVG